MQNRKLPKTGIVGLVVPAICCLTPILVVVLDALGQPAAGGRLDFILYPALAVFAIITV